MEEKMKQFFRMLVFIYIILIGFVIFGIYYWLKNKSYFFELEDIVKIVKCYVGDGKCYRNE